MKWSKKDATPSTAFKHGGVSMANDYQPDSLENSYENFDQSPSTATKRNDKKISPKDLSSPISPKKGSSQHVLEITARPTTDNSGSEPDDSDEEVDNGDLVGAVKIKDGLFIGDYICAEDMDFLLSNKISKVINCSAADVPNHFTKYGIQYLSYKWEEYKLVDVDQDLEDEIYDFIEEGFAEQQGILIHSNNGKNRCVIATVIYLIRKFRWSLIKTLEFLNSKKPGLELTATILKKLMDFESKITKEGVGYVTSDWNCFYAEVTEAQVTEEKILRNTYMNTLLHNENPEELKLKLKKRNKHKIKHSLQWVDQVSDRALTEIFERTLYPQEEQTFFKKSDPKPRPPPEVPMLKQVTNKKLLDLGSSAEEPEDVSSSVRSDSSGKSGSYNQKYMHQYMKKGTGRETMRDSKSFQCSEIVKDLKKVLKTDESDIERDYNEQDEAQVTFQAQIGFNVTVKPEQDKDQMKNTFLQTKNLIIEGQATNTNFGPKNVPQGQAAQNEQETKAAQSNYLNNMEAKVTMVKMKVDELRQNHQYLREKKHQKKKEDFYQSYNKFENFMGTIRENTMRAVNTTMQGESAQMTTQWTGGKPQQMNERVAEEDKQRVFKREINKSELNLPPIADTSSGRKIRNTNQEKQDAFMQFEKSNPYHTPQRQRVTASSKAQSSRVSSQNSRLGFLNNSIEEPTGISKSSYEQGYMKKVSPYANRGPMRNGMLGTGMTVGGATVQRESPMGNRHADYPQTTLQLKPQLNPYSFDPVKEKAGHHSYVHPSLNKVSIKSPTPQGYSGSRMGSTERGGRVNTQVYQTIPVAPPDLALPLLAGERRRIL